MQLSSFTSSFEFGPSERAIYRNVPWAAIVMLACVFAMESVLEMNRQWFADEAIWQWEAKSGLARQGVLDGEIVVFGTSVLFHGLDPTPANKAIGGSTRTVNLALNGMRIQHATQELRERLADQMDIDAVLLEIRNPTVSRESWLAGPYYRRWASWGDLAESRLYYWDPSLFVSFAANRALPSFCYRRGLDNWVFECVKSRQLSTRVYRRNIENVRIMSDRNGFAPFGDESLALSDRDTPPPMKRSWEVGFAGDVWLRKLLNVCRQHGVSVVLCYPPAPHFVERDRARSGYYPAREKYLSQLRADYPEIHFTVFAPQDYSMEMFSDDHHFSRAGRVRFSNDFAAWLQERKTDADTYSTDHGPMK